MFSYIAKSLLRDAKIYENIIALRHFPKWTSLTLVDKAFCMFVPQR